MMHVPCILRDVDPARWKGVIMTYISSQMAEDIPTGLMDMLCSKACRSVHPPFIFPRCVWVEMMV